MGFAMSIIGYVALFVLALTVFSFTKQRNEYLKLIFNDKDLPEVKVFKVGKHQLARVRLYGLKRKDDGKIDREDYYYSLIGRIINAKWQFELNDDNGIDVIIPDFKLAENKEDFLDIIATCTNFDLRKFVFKGDDKHKLFSIDAPIINAMKQHAEEIIDEVFRDMCATIEEEGLIGDIELN